MITIEQLTTWLGWTAVLHMGLLTLTLVALTLMRGIIMPLHSRILQVPAEQLGALYVRYLAAYKVAVLVFSIVPWVALKLMGY